MPDSRHEVEHFHRCLLGRKRAPRPDCPPEPGVEPLDRVRRVNDLSELDRELEERNELIPRGLPRSDRCRVLPDPLLGEHGEPGLGRSDRRGRIFSAERSGRMARGVCRHPSYL